MKKNIIVVVFYICLVIIIITSFRKNKNENDSEKITYSQIEQADVKVAVNDFLKAITASLLMEQVMAPNWHFKTIIVFTTDYYSIFYR